MTMCYYAMILLQRLQRGHVLAGLITVANLIASLSLSAQSWVQMSGITAQDIGVGKNGSVWATGTNGAIYRLNGSNWETMPGGAVRLAVAPDGGAWAVNAGGQIWRFNLGTNNWSLMPGAAKDIGVGGDGSVWVIGTGATQGGFEIYRWSGSGWNKVAGGATRISVDPSGNAWVINNSNTIFRFNGSGFEALPGSMQDVGVGADGSVWATGTDDAIFKWVNNSWQRQTGGAMQVAVGPDGQAWVVNRNGVVFRSGGTNASPGSPATPTPAPTPAPTASAPTKGTVLFQNTGNLPVKLFRTTADNRSTEVSEIAGNSGIEVEASLRERFTVQVIDHPSITHRTVYVVSLDEPVLIKGNVAMKDFGGYGVSFSQLNIDPNLFGVDTAILNTRNLVTSMNKKQIFERLDVTRGIDYETISPYLIKTGFAYAGTPLSVSTSRTRMSYGYSSFSSGWNIAASGAFPVKAVDVSGGFGYGETQSNQSANTEVYTYNRDQTITHQVAVETHKAYLNPEFQLAARRVSDAAAADRLVQEYGTHYPEVVYYGGDLSGYLKMSSAEYMRARSMNLDVQAAVEMSTPTKTKSKGYTKTTSSGSTYGGKMSFGYNESQEQRSLLENSESQVRIIGGQYVGDVYEVNEGNAAPLAVSLRRIDELFDPKVFKDDSDPARLEAARKLVQQAIARHISARVPAGAAAPLPPPNVYVVTLTKMQVMSHTDDANANTKGRVSASVFRESSLSDASRIPHLKETLWEQRDYSLDIRFSPNFSRDFNQQLYFVQLPDSVSRSFRPFFLRLSGEITEKDDIIWAPDGGRLTGSSGPIDLNALNLQPGGAAATRTFDISASGTGTIRITCTIRREATPFELPDALNWKIENPTQTAAARQPAEEVELTLINSGGYAAKFEVNYTVHGKTQTYHSGNTPLGWRYKLMLPPEATNVRVQAWAATGVVWDPWKSIFDRTLSSVTSQCFKVFNTTLDPKWNTGCN